MPHQSELSDTLDQVRHYKIHNVLVKEFLTNKPRNTVAYPASVRNGIYFS